MSSCAPWKRERVKGDLMEGLTVITNNVPRDVVDGWELSADERAEFDYIAWDAVEDGTESCSFIRYRGELYDLGEFSRWDNPSSPLGSSWDGMLSDSFFSGVLVRYADESCETVVVGRYYS